MKIITHFILNFHIRRSISQQHKDKKVMKILLLLGFIVIIVKGQVPEPHCCTPDEQWEANEGFMIGSVTGGVAVETQVRFYDYIIYCN